MVGVWEGLNLGSIPNDHMPSQKDPKISIERRCSTILPVFLLTMVIVMTMKMTMRIMVNVMTMRMMTEYR